jgi:PAS domain S-box-containing protein
MSNDLVENFLKPNDLLQAVFDSSPNGIAVMQNIYNKNGKVEDFSILLFNAYTLNWIGDIDYKGRRYSEVFPMVKQKGILEKFIAVAETGITSNFKSWYDGEGMKHWFHFTAVKQGELLVVTTEDITTAKKVEEALRESEKFNRTTLESSLDCLKVLDTEGRLTYMNYNGTCIMEIDDFSAVKDKSWWDLWPDDSKEIVKSAIAQALAGETAQFQAFCPTAKGTPRWWDVTVSPITSTDDSISQLISVSRDITEKRVIEQSLKESEARLRAMIEQAPVAIGLTRGDDFVFESINEPMLQIIHQKSKADVIGKRMIEDVLTEMKGQPIEDMLLNVLQTGETYRGYEVPVPLTLNGVLYNGYYNISYTRIIEPDGTPSIMHMGVNVTQQVLARQRIEESEARFRSLIEEAPIAMALYTGSDLKIELINETMVGYMGKGRSIIGKPLAQALPELEGQAFVHNFQNVFNTGQPFQVTSAPAELVIDGEKRQFYFDYTAKALRAGNGEIYGVLNMGVDVTEQVVSRKKLEESEQHLELLRNSVPAMIFYIDAEQRYQSYNETFMKWFGVSRTEAIGKTIREFIGEKAYERVGPHLSIAYGGRQERFEMPAPLRLGEDKWLSIVYTPHKTEEGNVIGVIVHATDITHIKKAEMAVRESEQRFQNLVRDASAGIIVLTGLEMKTEIVNEAFGKLIGRTPEELLDKLLFTIIPETEEYYRPICEQVRQTGEPVYLYDSPYTVVADGKQIDGFLHLTYQPYRDTDGNILGVMILCQDVTESVKAKKALEQSESRFRALVNASSDVMYSLNADWTIMYPLDGRGFLSDAQAPITNWMEQNVHPSEFEIVKKTIAAAIANKSVFELEHKVVTANGSIGWTFSRAVPILDEQGNITEWFGTASDITARKKMEDSLIQSESRFRTMADLVPQILWTARADGVVDYYNKVWYEYTGSHFNTDTAENTWGSFIHPEDLPEMAEVWNRSISNETPYQFEFRLKEAKTGEYRWFIAKGVPVRDAEGDLIKWFGATGDIHEQKEFTEKLEHVVDERTKELQRSNEDLQQFAHVASHDLKEPVRKVKTFVSRLEQHLDGKLDETGRRFTERIHSAANRMFTMIDGVLAYSTINASTQETQPVNLNEVLKNIEIDLEVIIQQTNTKIRYDQLPTIEGASVLLYQLFYNLINNSLKFAKANIPPQIIVMSEMVIDDNRRFAKLTLSDNGIGFEDGQAEMIFDTFTRLNSKDKFEGTGLGLALCKKIVERHGGRISASGIPGEGAAFTIWLPEQQNEYSI